MGDWHLTLYVAGNGELATRAQTQLTRIVRHHLAGECQVTVVDVLQQPRLARTHRVVATPLLVREQPLPVIKILGDLSDLPRILSMLGLALPPAPEETSDP